MMNGGKFLLDANVLIEAKRRYYAFDLCPGFWDAVAAHHKTAQIFSIDRVREEFEQGEDDLAHWIADQIPTCFESTDAPDIFSHYGAILQWVMAQGQFNPEAKTEFASAADGWLIAYAKAKNLTVVTHEVYAPEARRKIPIPNVCKAFDVVYVDTFTMLRDLGVKFIWQSLG